SCATAAVGIAAPPIRTATAAPMAKCLRRIAFLPLVSPARKAGRCFPLSGCPPAGFVSECALSVGERPHPQFLLADLPEPRQPKRLYDQEKDDERSDHHELDVFDGRSVN